MAKKSWDRPLGDYRKKMQLIANALIAAVLIHGLIAYPAAEPDTLIGPFREFLEKDIGLTKAEMQSLIAARPVAKLLETNTNDEVAIFGVVRIRASQELFIEKYRNIVAFESGSGVHAAGLFHSPPLPSDVAALQIDNKDLKEIPKCKAGDCAIKLSDRAMRALREQIDWTSPQAGIQAQSMIRQAFVDYLANYQKIGDEALSADRNHRTDH